MVHSGELVREGGGTWVCVVSPLIKQKRDQTGPPQWGVRKMLLHVVYREASQWFEWYKHHCFSYSEQYKGCGQLVSNL